MLRDGATEEAVKARIGAQMSLEEKEKYAHVVIDNSGTIDNTQRQAAEQLRKLKEGL